MQRAKVVVAAAVNVEDRVDAAPVVGVEEGVDDAAVVDVGDRVDAAAGAVVEDGVDVMATATFSPRVREPSSVEAERSHDVADMMNFPTSDERTQRGDSCAMELGTGEPTQWSSAQDDLCAWSRQCGE